MLRRVLLYGLVLGLTSVLTNNPPQHAKAAPVNKQEVQQVESKTEAHTVQPQPVVEEITPPQPEPVSRPIGCANYTALVQQYNWNATVAINVMRAESGCNPYAVGDTWVINGVYAPSCGLFQVRTLQGRPDCETLKNPSTNVEWAYKVYLSQGWKAWSVCRTKVSCY